MHHEFMGAGGEGGEGGEGEGAQNGPTLGLIGAPSPPPPQAPMMNDDGVPEVRARRCSGDQRGVQVSRTADQKRGQSPRSSVPGDAFLCLKTWRSKALKNSPLCS